MVIYEYLNGELITSVQDEDGFWIEKGRFPLRGKSLKNLVKLGEVYDGLTGERLVGKKD